MQYHEIRATCRGLLFEIRLMITDFEMGLPDPAEADPTAEHLRAITSIRDQLASILKTHNTRPDAQTYRKADPVEWADGKSQRIYLPNSDRRGTRPRPDHGRSERD